MRLGLYGGSFDPVHYGHLLLAECCREMLRLDEVWLIPAAVPPHKQSRALASAKQRLEMLELALGGHEQIKASRLEIDRGSLSYTVDTLAEVQNMYPGATLFLLMGADSLHDMPTWREPGRICALSIPAVVCRGGAAPPDFSVLAPLVTPQRLAIIRAAQVQMPLVELSSTDLRERAATGLSLRYRTPRAVEKYIETQRLYRADSSSEAKTERRRDGESD
jgi:nicotinate-nucleotide adenylyltransferase